MAMIDTCPADQQRTDYERLLDFMQQNTKTFIGRCKNKVIQNLSENLDSVANADNARSLLMQFRARAATRWQAKGMDVCQARAIGVARRTFTRSYEKQLDEKEFTKQLAEDAELERETAELHALAAGENFKPTAWEKGEHEFCVKQTAAFADIYESHQVQDYVDGNGRSVVPPVTSLTDDGCFVEYSKRIGDISDRLTNKFEKKTLPPVFEPPGPGDDFAVSPEPQQPNPDQQRVLNFIAPQIERYSLFNMDPKHSEPVTAMHLLVTGGPGTGKTFVYRKIAELMDTAGVSYLSAGALGSCAANMGNGSQTIHSLLDIAVPRRSSDAEKKKRGENLEQPQLNASQLTELRKRFKGIQFLFLDEISTISAAMLATVDERMQQACENNLPFGGVVRLFHVAGYCLLS